MPRKEEKKAAERKATKKAAAKKALAKNQSYGARKKRPSDDAIKDALVRHDANVYHAAKDLGIPRGSLAAYISQSPELRAFKDELFEGVIDKVESVLLRKCIEGDNTCIFFFLKTRAQHRGYVERLQSNILANLTVKLDWGDGNDKS